MTLYIISLKGTISVLAKQVFQARNAWFQEFLQSPEGAAPRACAAQHGLQHLGQQSSTFHPSVLAGDYKALCLFRIKGKKLTIALNIGPSLDMSSTSLICSFFSNFEDGPSLLPSIFICRLLPFIFLQDHGSRGMKWWTCIIYFKYKGTTKMITSCWHHFEKNISFTFGSDLVFPVILQ